MTEETLEKAYLHQKIADSYCEKDIRFSTVLSALPWKYIIDCRNDIKDGQKRSNEIRADTSKFSERILSASAIENITSVLQDMSDKARTEDDSNEVRHKYVKLQEDIQTLDWSKFTEGTFPLICFWKL